MTGMELATQEMLGVGETLTDQQWLTALGYALVARRRAKAPAIDRAGRETWRMPPLAELSRSRMSMGRRIGMGALRLYLAAAVILVVVKIVQVALGH
jgi:hypothetical protein